MDTEYDHASTLGISDHVDLTGEQDKSLGSPRSDEIPLFFLHKSSDQISGYIENHKDRSKLPQFHKTNVANKTIETSSAGSTSKSSFLALNIPNLPSKSAYDASQSQNIAADLSSVEELGFLLDTGRDDSLSLNDLSLPKRSSLDIDEASSVRLGSEAVVSSSSKLSSVHGPSLSIGETSEISEEESASEENGRDLGSMTISKQNPQVKPSEIAPGSWCEDSKSKGDFLAAAVDKTVAPATFNNSILANVIRQSATGRYFGTTNAGTKDSVFKPAARFSCFNCKEFGHFASACPNVTVSPGCLNCGSDKHEAFSCVFHNLCFLCDDIGHKQQHCPYRSRNREAVKQYNRLPGYGRSLAMYVGPASAAERNALNEWITTPGTQFQKGSHSSRNGRHRVWLPHEEQEYWLSAYEQRLSLHPHTESILIHACSYCGGGHSWMTCPRFERDSPHLTCSVCGTQGHAYCDPKLPYYLDTASNAKNVDVFSHYIHTVSGESFPDIENTEFGNTVPPFTNPAVLRTRVPPGGVESVESMGFRTSYLNRDLSLFGWDVKKNQVHAASISHKFAANNLKPESLDSTSSSPEVTDPTSVPSVINLTGSNQVKCTNEEESSGANPSKVYDSDSSDSDSSRQEKILDLIKFEEDSRNSNLRPFVMTSDSSGKNSAPYGTCFNCGKGGHFGWRCPKARSDFGVNNYLPPAPPLGYDRGVANALCLDLLEKYKSKHVAQSRKRHRDFTFGNDKEKRTSQTTNTTTNANQHPHDFSGSLHVPKRLQREQPKAPLAEPTAHDTQLAEIVAQNRLERRRAKKQRKKMERILSAESSNVKDVSGKVQLVDSLFSKAVDTGSKSVDESVSNEKAEDSHFAPDHKVLEHDDAGSDGSFGFSYTSDVDDGYGEDWSYGDDPEGRKDSDRRRIQNRIEKDRKRNRENQFKAEKKRRKMESKNHANQGNGTGTAESKPMQKERERGRNDRSHPSESKKYDRSSNSAPRGANHKKPNGGTGYNKDGPHFRDSHTPNNSHSSNANPNAKAKKSKKNKNKQTSNKSEPNPFRRTFPKK